jgi:hypothetical protein
LERRNSRQNVLLEDATCYEVYIRFPTDVKFLWEACEWLWAKQISDICHKNKLKSPRSKYKEQHKKHLAYSKLRKKFHRKTKARIRTTLHLLEKGIIEFQGIINQTKAVDLSSKFLNKIHTFFCNKVNVLLLYLSLYFITKNHFLHLLRRIPKHRLFRFHGFNHN